MNQNIAAKLERIKKTLNEEKRKQFQAPLYDLQKLRQDLDKNIPVPADMKGYFAKVIRNPNNYEEILDEALKIADLEEGEVLRELKKKSKDDIYNFANYFVRQEKPLPIFLHNSNF